MKTLASDLKIGICGLGRAGKDTAAEYLASITPLVYTAGTSYWARHIVFRSLPWWKRLWYWNADRCWRIHRHKDRGYWAKKIGEYNQEDPVQLYRDCLTEQNFLTGVRWKHEFKALQRAKLCDLWIWIERPGCVDPTCEIQPWDCDIIVQNNGTLEEFKARLNDLKELLLARDDTKRIVQELDQWTRAERLGLDVPLAGMGI